MFVYVDALTIWGVIEPITCTLSRVISSVPVDKAIIVQGTAVWKSEWAERDWIINLVIQV